MYNIIIMYVYMGSVLWAYVYCSNGGVFFERLFTQLACALITLFTHNTFFQNLLSFILNQSIHEAQSLTDSSMSYCLIM